MGSSKKHDKLISRLYKYANLTGNCQLLSFVNNINKTTLEEKNNNKVKVKNKI